jgi:hypothetical protein
VAKQSWHDFNMTLRFNVSRENGPEPLAETIETCPVERRELR